jgi:iron complex outermembrane receptor protein
VLKGPAAAIYGFNAFDGVVNIVTKDPDEMKGTAIQVGAGEFGTIRSSAVYANRWNRIGSRLSIGHDQNQQWRKDDRKNVEPIVEILPERASLNTSSKILIRGRDKTHINPNGLCAAYALKFFIL